MNEGEFDVFGITEVNVDWRTTAAEHTLKGRIQEWWPTGTAVARTANNQTSETTESKQWGGVAVISRFQAAIRIMGQGEDPTKLGRWVWQRYRGANQQTLRIAIAYRPCRPRSKGFLNTHAQQRRYFNEKKKDREPRAAMIEDLQRAIQTWRSEGDHVIVAMDCNEDTDSTTMQAFREATGLHNTMEWAGDEVSRLPTHRLGKVPIDGIFATAGVKIEGAGASEWDEGIQLRQADHRCLWIDINMVEVLGQSMPALRKAVTRRVKTEDPRIVQKFNDAYEAHLKQHKARPRAFRLEREAKEKWTREMEQEAEELDKIRVEGIWKADEKCRRLRMGGIPYSREYKRIEARIGLWNNVVRKRKGANISSKVTVRLAKRAGEPRKMKELMRCGNEEVEKEQEMAYTELKQFRTRAVKARENWLEGLVVARGQEEVRRREEQQGQDSRGRRTVDRGEVTAQQLRQLRKKERVRATYRRIRMATGGNATAGISMVIAPDADGKWVERTSKEEIERGCMDENKRRFRQTEDTPFMHGQLAKEFGYLGVTEAAEQTLRGEYVPRPWVDEGAKQLLRGLQSVAKTRIPAGMTTEEFQQGWRRAKEDTSAGPSGLHFGHFKAIAYHRKNSEFEASMTSVAMVSGYSYRRWRKGTDVELMKKANSFRVDKLRTIVLFEADFNFANKAIGRKAAHQAEQQEGFAEEQYGSRKRHRAIDHALNKQLTMDWARQVRVPTVLCTNDLKSCYDRIVHTVASMGLQRQGIAQSEVVCMFSTLQQLEHYIRTAYGESRLTYGGQRWVVPMQGIYQGNGAGPVIWAVISLPVLETMKREGHTANFRTAVSGEEVQMVGYAFVDDTDLVVNARDGEDVQQAIRRMQRSIQSWESLARATGGALVVEKCMWWAIDFKWNEDGTWRYATEEETPAALMMKGTTGIPQAMPRSGCEEAFETLGVKLAPDGNGAAIEEALQGKAEKWVEQVRTWRMRQADAETALRTVLMKKLEYVLPVAQLSRDQCGGIMKPVWKAMMSKVGFNKGFPREMAYASAGWLGADLHELHTTQVTEHVKMVLEHGERMTMTGKLLRGCIQAMKTEVGVGTSMFEVDYKAWEILATQSWVKTVWQEASEYGIRIREKTETAAPAHDEDEWLMVAFRDAGYNRAQQVRLNRCRIIMKAVSVADVIEAKSKRAMAGRQDNDKGRWRGRRHVGWPRQGDVPAKDWALWDQALRRVAATARTGTMWDVEQVSTIRSEDKQVLWVREGGHEWRLWRANDEAIPGMEEYTRTECTAVLPPEEWRVVYVRERGGRLRVVGTGGRARRSQAKRATRLQQLEGKWLQAVMQGKAVVSTDGSYKQGRSTAAYSLDVKGRRRGLVAAAGKVPGREGVQSAYRAELGGILQALRKVESIIESFGAAQAVTGKMVIVACDNKMAGIHAIQYTRDVGIAVQHFDVLREIRSIQRRLPVTLEYRHVYGHQLERDRGVQRDEFAEWNDDVDKAAGAAHFPEAEYADEEGAKGEWAVWLGNRKVCTNASSLIRQFIQGQKTAQWQRKVGRLRHGEERRIDVGAAQLAMGRLQPSRRKWVAKHACSFGPVGRNMYKWKFWDNDKCPVCGEHEETTEHVMQCAHPLAVAVRREALKEWESEMMAARGDGPMVKELVRQVWAWTEGNEVGAEGGPRLQKAVADQKDIGWGMMIRGRWSTKWRRIQESTMVANDQPGNPDNWIARAMVGLWEARWKVWTARNKVLHDDEMAAQRARALQEATVAVQVEWRKGVQGICGDDVRLLTHTTEAAVRAQPAERQMQWVRHVRAAQQAGRRRGKGHHVRRQTKRTTRGLRQDVTGRRVRQRRLPP